MNVRRVFGLVLVALFAVGAAALSRQEESSQVVDSSGAQATRQLPPVAASGAALSTSWYCPGVPLGGKDYAGTDYGGEVLVANPGDTELRGVVTRYSTDKQVLINDIVIPARDTVLIDFDAGATGSYVSALVEIAGSGDTKGVSVEQRAIYPAGDSRQGCANSASEQWFFADGFTASDSKEDLLLTNPLPDSTVVDIRFVTKDGERTPSQLQGYVLAPNSLSVLSIADQGARGEVLVGVEIRAQSGALVAARAQHYLGTGRLGYSVKLGAADSQTDWWIASGDYRGKPAEQIDIFNPHDDDAQLSVLFMGGEAMTVAPMSITVPAHRVIALSMANVEGLPEKPFAVSLSVLEGEGIVVEHVATRQVGENVATSIDAALPQIMASREWRIPVAAPPGTPEALILLNISASPAMVSIKAIGPAGELPIAGMDAIAVEPGTPTYVSMPPGTAFGQLIATSDVEVLLLRSQPRTMGVKGRDVVAAFPMLASSIR